MNVDFDFSSPGYGGHNDEYGVHTETWKSVPGLDDEIFVSDKGRVQQWDPRLKRWSPKKEATVLRHGYYTVTHRQKIRRVHQLVALAFVGPRPSSQHTVDHENRCRTDNRPSNLSWQTKQHQRKNQKKATARVDKNIGHVALEDDEEFREVRCVLVSQYGKTKNKFGIVFTPIPNETLDYAMVGTQRHMFHILVAEAFPEIVGTKPTENHTVDHINRIKHDNRATNLRWATRSEQQINTNRKHADKILKNLKIAVEVRPPGTNRQWETYPSTAAASRGIQKNHGRRIPPSAISQAVRKNPEGHTIRLRQNVGWSFRLAD